MRIPPQVSARGIVNLSAGLTGFSHPGTAAYVAMKGAVATLTLYITKESGSRGIAVKVVAAGAIATDFVGGSLRDDPRINRLIATQTALDRGRLHYDIGDVIASLL